MPATIYPALGATTNRPLASVDGGVIRANLEVFNLATDGTGTYELGAKIPKGARILRISLNTSVTFGASAQIAIGITGTTGKYRAAATFTTADQWVALALNSVTGVELTAEEQLLMTVTVASLPASGKLLVLVEYISARD